MRFLARITLLTVLIASPAVAANGTFLTEVDDLPLAPGLVELPGGTLFDAPQGRIVEATAKGQMLEAEVRVFYDETLPQLGWARVGIDSYRRDKETLRIEITTEAMQAMVHFSIAPVKQPDQPADKDKDKEAK